jgi:hypothetical protein
MQMTASAQPFDPTAIASIFWPDPDVPAAHNADAGMMRFDAQLVQSGHRMARCHDFETYF